MTLEPKLDLSFILESVSVPIPFIIEPKSSISQNHIPLLDQDLDQYDSVMISQDWHITGKKFHARILHDPIHIGEYKNVKKKEVIKGGFHENSQYLDWAETLGSIRPPSEPPPWDENFPSLSPFSCIIAFHSYIENNAWVRCEGGFTNMLTSLIFKKILSLKLFEKKTNTLTYFYKKLS